MTIAAWCEGISVVTGEPCTRPAAGAVDVLVRALRDHAPSDAEPVAWAKSQGEAYALAQRGTKLSAFGFSDWLSSGRPARSAPASGPGATTIPGGAPVGESREHYRARQRRADAEHERLRATAAPAPVADLMAAIGGKRGGNP